MITHSFIIILYVCNYPPVPPRETRTRVYIQHRVCSQQPDGRRAPSGTMKVQELVRCLGALGYLPAAADETVRPVSA